MAQSSANTMLLSAGKFLDSIGVNTHVGYAWAGYNNASLVSQSMTYLGVTTMRDALGSSPAAQPVLAALADSGFKFDFIVSSSTPAGGANALNAYVDALESFAKAHPGSIVALEGLNEANVQKFTYEGSSSMSAAGKFQQDLYLALKAEVVLKDIPVYNLTLGHNNTTDYAALGDMSAWSDYANAHAYVSTNSTVSAALSASLVPAKTSAGTAPTVITETGYTTLASAAEVGASETAQAKSILNTLVAAFERGVEKTYLYELFDRGSDPANIDKEAHFGLFRLDGSPKLAASAIHNLTRILADDGTGTAQPTTMLGYDLAGLPAGGGSMMMAKSNGAYDLVVWAAPKVWDDANDKDIVNAVQPVTVHFADTQAKVYVYDPLGGSSPIATYTNVQDIVLPISDHPLIVEIGGPGPLPPEQVVTPAAVSGTAAEIVADLAMLNASTTLESITLTDGKPLPVASAATLAFIIANYQTALSKIDGEHQFSIVQTAPTWQKTEIYDAAGHLVSTTNAGLTNGIIFTQQTKFTDGTVDTVNFSNGVKANETIHYANGSKETFKFGITGLDYASEHSSYDANGKLLSFERLHSDATPAYREVYSAGHKIVSWYDAKGVITTQKDWAPDGSLTSQVYVGGVLSRMFVTNADKTGMNATYDIKGQSYVTEVQKLDASGKVYEVIRSHADGTLDYTFLLKADGSKTTTLYDAKGHKLNAVTVEADGDRFTDIFNATTGALTRQIIQTAAGDYTTKAYTAGVLTSINAAHPDRSTDVTLFDAQGVMTKMTHQEASGYIKTQLYVDGALSRLFITNADKSSENTTYNIKGQSYVTEVQKLDAAGKVIEVVRSHADGTLDYTSLLKADGTKIVTVYDAKGHKLNAVTIETDGDRFTDIFNATTGALTRQIIQTAAGDYTTKAYTAGVLTSINAAHPDRSTDVTLFDAQGVMTKMTHQEASGYIKTQLYVDGALSRLFITNADKSSENTTYNIKGQSYVTEVQKLDAAGKVIEVVRSHADGTLDYTSLLKADGTKIVTVYDAKGHKLNAVTIETDGDRFTDLFDAASGALTRQILQTAAGDYTTKDYTAGVLTTVTAAHADGSSDVTLFDVNGAMTKTTHQEANGYTKTAIYSDGVLSRLFVTNADKTSENTSYNIKGQSYVTETQKLDAAGKVVEVIRSHQDGTLDYTSLLKADGTKITTVYDTTGHKLSTVTVEADGDRFTDLFDAATGNLTRQIEQSTNGDVTTTDYKAGVHASTTVVHADGSKEIDLFDANGILTKSTQQEANGHTETSIYVDGALSRLFITNADKTSENTTYNIKGQSYVTETQKLDAAGKVVDVARSHADGTPDYHWTLASDGTRTTTTYDAAGSRVAETIVHPDKSTDVFKFVVAGQPGAVQHEVYDTASKLTITDITNADGTHKVYAQTTGVTLHGSDGDDAVQMFGGGSFVFTHGNDKIVNFHADDLAANHDVIQVSKSLAVNFEALQLTKIGSDTLVAFNDHDSVLLKGVSLTQVTAADFLFA